ncbi:hypothetical protein RUND412_007052 [Rhizina undulata]
MFFVRDWRNNCLPLLEILPACRHMCSIPHRYSYHSASRPQLHFLCSLHILHTYDGRNLRYYYAEIAAYSGKAPPAHVHFITILNKEVWDLLSEEIQQKALKFLPEHDKVYDPVDASKISEDIQPKARLADNFWEANKVMFELQEDFQRLVSIDLKDYSFTFAYPPGTHQDTSAEQPDKIISNVISMGSLETVILKEDGRGPDSPANGNAFKVFGIKRAAQDIVSLFEVCADLYSKYMATDANK